jgi:hypothetical protein
VNLLRLHDLKLEGPFDLAAILDELEQLALGVVWVDSLDLLSLLPIEALLLLAVLEFKVQLRRRKRSRERRHTGIASAT